MDKCILYQIAWICNNGNTGTNQVYLICVLFLAIEYFHLNWHNECMSRYTWLVQIKVGMMLISIIFSILEKSVEIIFTRSSGHMIIGSCLLNSLNMHNRQKLWNIWKAQWRHSYWTFRFARNSLALATNKYYEFNATVTCSVMDQTTTARRIAIWTLDQNCREVWLRV